MSYRIARSYIQVCERLGDDPAIWRSLQNDYDTTGSRSKLNYQRIEFQNLETLDVSNKLLFIQAVASGETPCKSIGKFLL